MLENIGNAITRLPMDRFGRNVGSRIPSYSRHVRHDIIAMPWQGLLPSNGSWNIQQLWASGGQTREPSLLKFGTPQSIKT